MIFWKVHAFWLPKFIPCKMAVFLWSKDFRLYSSLWYMLTFCIYYLLYVHYMFTIYSLYVHYISTVCSLYVHYIFTICSLDIHYMFTMCSLYIHYMFTMYPLYVHYVFTICSLYIHCILTIYYTIERNEGLWLANWNATFGMLANLSKHNITMNSNVK